MSDATSSCSESHYAAGASASARGFGHADQSADGAEEAELQLGLSQFLREGRVFARKNVDHGLEVPDRRRSRLCGSGTGEVHRKKNGAENEECKMMSTFKSIKKIISVWQSINKAINP